MPMIDTLKILTVLRKLLGLTLPIDAIESFCTIVDTEISESSTITTQLKLGTLSDITKERNWLSVRFKGLGIISQLDRQDT